MKDRRCGWIPDHPDIRDTHYRAVAPTPIDKIDLRPFMPPVYNQGNLGSCTANGVCALLQYMAMQTGVTFSRIAPSRLFVYFNTRSLEGTINEDAGGMIRDAVKAANRWGAPSEVPTWPYVEDHFTMRPSPAAYKEAERDQALAYKRVSNVIEIEHALASKLPVVFGTTLYDSFNKVEADGIVHMPATTEQPMGGHCMVIVGFDRAKQHFIVRNSWGKEWGKEGYCFFPYAYIGDRNLTDDMWVISKIG